MILAVEKCRIGILKGQSPFGAAIADKSGNLVCTDHNHVFEKNDPTAHAEVSAVRKACKKLKTIKLKDCTIYSTTEPCPMCFSAIHWAGIKRIVFGTRIEDVQKLGFSEIPISNSQMKKLGKTEIIIEKDFMRKENLELLNFWKKNRKSRTY
ncbi:nucleoside deaminase [Candidatus Micrarchaeota archaeon]|nr:nucleoside deaminase [Candidatus Micrarchaeota archaeon]